MDLFNDIDYQFSYDDDEHSGLCIISHNNKEFSGVAICDPHDYDFESHKTGLTIAEYRATIDMLKYEKEIHEIQLRTLLDYESLVNHSRQSNETSYERRQLTKYIQRVKDELQEIKDCIQINKAEVGRFIADKETFYVKMRKMRADEKKKSLHRKAQQALDKKD